VLSSGFALAETGTFILEGYPADASGTIIGTVDREELEVR